MLSFKRVLLAIFTIFLMHLSVSAQKNIFNAYYLAKELVNTDNYRIDSTSKDPFLAKMLGGVLWYASNDFDNIKTIDNLKKICVDKYPILSGVVNNITTSLLRNFNLFDFDVKELEKILKANLKDTKAINHSLINVKNLIDDYSETMKISRDILKGEYLPKLKYLQSDSNNTEKNKGSKQSEIKNLNKQIDESIFEPALKINLREKLKILNKELEQISINLGLIKDYEKQKEKYDSLELRKDSLIKKAKEIVDGFSEEIKLQLRNINPNYSVIKENLALVNSSRSQFESLVINSKEKAENESNTKISLALPNQTQLIDAMAIYLVKRVKQESVLWFFESIRKNARTYSLLEEVFPETMTLLRGKEIYEAPKMGSMWQYAISKDFVIMPENLLNSKWLNEKLGENNKYLGDLKTAVRMGRMFQQQYSYGEVINSLYSNIPFKHYASNKDAARIDFNTIITLLYCIKEEFVKTTGTDGKNYVSLKLADLLHMTNDEFEVMLTLIDLKYNHLIQKILKIARIDINNNLHLNTLKRWLGNILIKIDQFEKIGSNLDNVKKAIENIGDNPFQFKEFSNTWKFVADLAETFNVSKDDLVVKTVLKGWEDTDIQKLMNYISAIQEFFYMLEKKNFAGCVNVLFATVDSLRSGSVEDGFYKITKGKFDTLITKLNMKHYEKIKTEIDSSKNIKKINYELDGEFIKININSPLYNALNLSDNQAITTIKEVAGFLNDVSVSKSSKELAKTIEAYAMPPGSYKMKRDSWFSFDFNAYVGMYSGVEWINGSNLKDISRKGMVYGVTAPIGFSFSKTLGKKLKKDSLLDKEYADNVNKIKYKKKDLWKKSATTLSLFISAIDIGAVVSYRFGSNDSILPQKVKLAQVFSPGVHFNLGIKNTPLVISTGFQFTPSLRNIDASSGNQAPKNWNANRVYLGVLFDIPLFNFYTSSSQNKFNRISKKERKY